MCRDVYNIVCGQINVIWSFRLFGACLDVDFARETQTRRRVFICKFRVKINVQRDCVKRMRMPFPHNTQTPGSIRLTCLYNFWLNITPPSDSKEIYIHYTVRLNDIRKHPVILDASFLLFYFAIILFSNL